MKKTKIKCGKCETYLLYDKNAIYNHWKYYCPNCDEFKVVK